MDKYRSWIQGSFDDDTKEELRNIEKNTEEIQDRFYKELEFGTGGLRGKIGAGTNRINRYTVSKATQGFGDYIINNGKKDKGIVIAYDSRHKSEEFAKTAALVLADNGIKAYLFDSLRSTPELSFAVRYLHAAGGIVITASHNPPEYNGYKVYGEDGCQLIPSLANEVISCIRDIDSFEDIGMMDEKEAKRAGLLEIIGEEVDNVFVSQVKKERVSNDIDKAIKVVYTPLHGTGNIPIRRVLKELGYKNIHVVNAQEKPDPNFSTVEYPNPEEPAVFEIAKGIGEEIDADLLLGTDPDCDRVGAVVRNNDGDFIVLNGNQTGALLLDYIMTNSKLSENGVIIKTVVTSELGRVIAQNHGLETIDTLTGFKFIGEKIGEFERNGDKEFLFGYEESFGYLKGTYARDKDAVVASMLIVEMAAFYKKRGISLYDALMDLYDRYGYFKESLHAIKLEGIEGTEKIKNVMDTYRQTYPVDINGKKVVKVNDYKESKTIDIEEGKEEKIDLPSSNVLKFILEDDSWFVLRPSGTEPKLKIYFSANGESREEVDSNLIGMEKDIVQDIMNMVK
ncbi:phospho-sugar mutase [Clostridium sp. D2Q-11]|uniref:Phosphoglucomutase n=1 Tax=Anaeromonas frigoriresistens TaxID=2683708 RepID=A0A942Z8D9_9FIRM|nr:phospho-sugar mutase [Anaeromonas frigoriresistens]MBS4537879.1 phospho-sugar mutase [Anaeromonas frigoriresistens]